MHVWSWSETQIEGNEEAASRRVGRDVHAASDLLRAEVADLGIEARILGPRHQVAAGQADVGRAEPSACGTEHETRGEIVACGQLAQLEVGGVLDVRGDAVIVFGEPLLGRGDIL